MSSTSKETSYRLKDDLCDENQSEDESCIELEERTMKMTYNQIIKHKDVNVILLSFRLSRNIVYFIANIRFVFYSDYVCWIIAHSVYTLERNEERREKENEREKKRNRRIEPHFWSVYTLTFHRKYHPDI